jgi:hypothetical protein
MRNWRLLVLGRCLWHNALNEAGVAATDYN